MKALIIEEWHQSHLARFGRKYRIEAVDAKRLHSLDHDRTPADLPELRAAFDTFFAKPFEAFPEGHTAMGFCGDPGRWIALSKRAAAGMAPVRNGRPVVDYIGGLAELEAWEQHERSLAQ